MSIKTEDLWKVINEYVYACEGNPEQNVHGNLSRQEAVVKIEQMVQILVDEGRADVLGLTVLPEEVEHVGVHAARTSQEHNALEKTFAEEWADRNDSCLNCPEPHGTLDYILAEDQQRMAHEWSQRDATVAASVIQWLGTEEGVHFLADVFVRCALGGKVRTVGRFFKNVLHRLHSEDHRVYWQVWSDVTQELKGYKS